MGFREALQLLGALGEARPTLLNLADLTGAHGSAVRAEACGYVERFDAVLVKSNWEWAVDRFARDFLAGCAVPRALLVSGSYAPPSPRALWFYDLAVFEVFWYEARHLAAHPAAVHGFGIDVRALLRGAAEAGAEAGAKTGAGAGAGTVGAAESGTGGTSANEAGAEARAEAGAEAGAGAGAGGGAEAGARGADWDLLFIGAMADHAGHKRPWKIGEQPRHLRRAAVGKQDGAEALQVVEKLRAAGVEVLPPRPYGELAALIRRTRAVRATFTPPRGSRTPSKAPPLPPLPTAAVDG